MKEVLFYDRGSKTMWEKQHVSSDQDKDLTSRDYYVTPIVFGRQTRKQRGAALGLQLLWGDVTCGR